MNIIGFCPYETPCGWCSKRDKKCDSKIGKENIINKKRVDNDELFKEKQEMTDEEIIKAFEHCTNHNTSCKPCPYCFIKNGELRCKSKQRNKDILDMIYRLKEQNEKLIKEKLIEIKNNLLFNMDKVVQQAVKDTAQDILDEVSRHYGGGWLVALYNKYGLEV